VDWKIGLEVGWRRSTAHRDHGGGQCKPRRPGGTVTATMNTDQALRAQLAAVLSWEDAHAGLDAALAGIPVTARGVRPEGLPHSAWELLEHLRIAQTDILDFCRNPKYAEKEWPGDYWPKSPAPPSPAAWDDSIAALRRDLAGFQALANDPAIDLFAKIPHGSGQTYLREILLVTDHNAYHAGQLVLIRRRLGNWKP
jgi:hypothetical protein